MFHADEATRIALGAPQTLAGQRFRNTWPAVCLCHGMRQYSRSDCRNAGSAGRHQENTGNICHAFHLPTRFSTPERQPRCQRPQGWQRAVPLHGPGLRGPCATRGAMHACLGTTPVAVAQPSRYARRPRPLAISCVCHLRAAVPPLGIDPRCQRSLTVVARSCSTEFLFLTKGDCHAKPDHHAEAIHP